MTVLLNSLHELNDHLNAQPFSSFTVLTDSNTHAHCLTDLLASCAALHQAEIIEVDAGEASKDIEIATGIWNVLLENKTDRAACMICLGGGMVTDLGGFVAATFKRGIACIYIPTSLLGMVDAAIGGKTGINLDSHKNQVGTFSNPNAIVTCTEWLLTLPERELRSGLAEILKHGLVADPNHFNQLAELKAFDSSAIAPLIRRSAEIKRHIVEQDFLEGGIRQVLNFGHTTGHAIEALASKDQNPLLHGEAVALGMICALHLSVAKLGLDANFADSACRTIERLILLPTGRMADYAPEQLWSLMQADKKNHGGEVRFVLLEALGKPTFGTPIEYADFVEAWKLTIA